MILYRLLGNIRKNGYFGIAHSLFTAHFKNVPLRGGQFLLSYRQLVDKVIVIYFFYGSVIQKMFVFTKAYVIFKIRTVDLLAETSITWFLAIVNNMDLKEPSTDKEARMFHSLRNVSCTISSAWTDDFVCSKAKPYKESAYISYNVSNAS